MMVKYLKIKEEHGKTIENWLGTLKLSLGILIERRHYIIGTFSTLILEMVVKFGCKIGCFNFEDLRIWFYVLKLVFFKEKLRKWNLRALNFANVSW